MSGAGAGVGVERADVGSLQRIVLAAVVNDADEDSRFSSRESFERLPRIIESINRELSKMRCCGSMAAASPGLIPKNAASN